MLLEILEKVYGRNKNGELKKIALNFCKKHNLDLNGENKIEDLAVAFSTLTNKEKKEIAIRMLFSEINVEKVEVKSDVDMLSIRKSTYKEACRKFHPDNLDTGSEGVFKFIQDVKMSFWDCEGNPRKEIKTRDWKKESEAKKNPIFKW